MKWDVLNIEGKKLRQVDLPESVFGCELDSAILHAVFRACASTHPESTLGRSFGDFSEDF